MKEIKTTGLILSINKWYLQIKLMCVVDINVVKSIP